MVPERLGSIAGVCSVVLTDGWQTTSPRRFSHILLFTSTNQLLQTNNTQHGPLPQQLYPLCLLVYPATRTASLKTPQIPLYTSSFHPTATQLLSTTTFPQLPNSAMFPTPTESVPYGLCQGPLISPASRHR